MERADIEESRAQVANETIVDDLTGEAGQRLPDQRVEQLSEAVAQTAIEYARNPVSAASAVDIYAEMLAAMPDSMAMAVLTKADQIAGQLVPADSLPSALYLDDSSADAVGELATEAAPETPIAEYNRTMTLPVSESQAGYPMPTREGMAMPVGEPFVDEALARERGLLRDLSGTQEGFDQEGNTSAIFSRNQRTPQFQQFVVPSTEPVVDADPAGDRMEGLGSLIASGGQFPEILPDPLLSNMGEIPSTDASGDFVSFTDRRNVRLAQALLDDFIEQKTRAEAAGMGEEFMASPQVQQAREVLGGLLSTNTTDPDAGGNPLRSFVETGNLGDRPAGVEPTETDKNPARAYNPLLADLATQQASVLRSGRPELGYSTRQRLARNLAEQEFADRFGFGLKDNLFNYSQYSIAEPNKDAAATRNLLTPSAQQYVNAVQAFDNVIAALNLRLAEEAGLPLSGVSFQPTSSPVESIGGMSAYGNQLANEIAGRFGNRKLVDALTEYQDGSNASQVAMNPLVSGLLASLRMGDAPSVGGRMMIPVTRPREFRVGNSVVSADALDRVNPLADTDMTSAFEQKIGRINRRLGIDNRSGNVIDPNLARTGSVNPYTLLPFTAQQYGIYFDPFSQQFGGRFVDGGSPYLPPELAAHLTANRMGYGPSEARSVLLDAILRGYNTYGHPDDAALQYRLNLIQKQAQRRGASLSEAIASEMMRQPTMPKASLLKGLRYIPQETLMDSRGNATRSARDIVNEAIERAGQPVQPQQLPQISPADSGIIPADDDLGALPSLYDQQYAMAPRMRMALPQRAGLLGNLMTA